MNRRKNWVWPSKRSGSRLRSERRSHKTRRVRTAKLQTLEQRIVLAHDAAINLDFTPDWQVPDDTVPGDFGEIFSLDHWQQHLSANPLSSPPQPWSNNRTRLLQILDFNGDDTLN